MSLFIFRGNIIISKTKNDTKITVSVIVPVYNGKKYVTETLNSLSAQTYTDYEIIIVDDGSTDGSYDILQQFAEKSPCYCRLFTHKDRQNLGIIETYLLGVTMAKGEYLAFLEQDDLWSPNYLEAKSLIFKMHPQVGIIFSRYRFMGNKIGMIEKAVRYTEQQLRTTINKPTDLFKPLLKKNVIGNFSSIVVRRKLFVDIPKPPSIVKSSYDRWVMLHAGIENLFYCDKQCHVLWRRHSDGEWSGKCLERRRKLFVETLEHYHNSLLVSIDRAEKQKMNFVIRDKKNLVLFKDFFLSGQFTSLCSLIWADPLWGVKTMINYYLMMIDDKFVMKSKDKKLS